MTRPLVLFCLFFFFLSMCRCMSKGFKHSKTSLLIQSMFTYRTFMQRKWLHVFWILQGTDKLETDEIQIWSNLLKYYFGFCDIIVKKCAVLDADVLQVNTRLILGGQGLDAMLLSAYSFKCSMSELWFPFYPFFLIWTVMCGL